MSNRVTCKCGLMIVGGRHPIDVERHLADCPKYQDVVNGVMNFDGGHPVSRKEAEQYVQQGMGLDV